MPRQRTQNPSPVVRDEAGVFVPPAPVVVLASDALRALHNVFVDTPLLSHRLRQSRDAKGEFRHGKREATPLIPLLPYLDDGRGAVNFKDGAVLPILQPDSGRLANAAVAKRFSGLVVLLEAYTQVVALDARQRDGFFAIEDSGTGLPRLPSVSGVVGGLLFVDSGLDGGVTGRFSLLISRGCRDARSLIHCRDFVMEPRRTVRAANTRSGTDQRQR